MNEYASIVLGEVRDIRNYSIYVSPNQLRREFPSLMEYTPIGLHYASNSRAVPLFMRYTYGTSLLLNANGVPSSENRLLSRTILEDLNKMNHTRLFLFSDRESGFIRRNTQKVSHFQIESQAPDVYNLTDQMIQSIHDGLLPVLYMEISGGMDKLVRGRKPFEADTVREICRFLEQYHDKIAMLGSVGSNTYDRMLPLLSFFTQVRLFKDHMDVFRSKQGVAYTHENIWIQTVADPEIVRLDKEQNSIPPIF